MKKYIPHISVPTLTLVLIFTASGFLFPQTIHAAWWDPTTWITIGDLADNILLSPLGWLAILLLQLASLITYLGGIVLNYVVQFTVVDMAENISKANAVNKAWETIRDVANMSFIFVLLYAAIKTILGMGSDTKKLIVRIVIVAILLNFSLFFTRVVIDASNVLAVTFYDAIAPSALRSNLSLGLSGSLMEPLQITSLMKTGPNAFDGKQLIIVGVMGTIVVLIAAFVFFAAAIMFVIRFVVLIFVLILSPLAFIGFILPGLETYKNKWLDALLGQAFFAPIYFMLTWIVIIVSRGLLTKTGGDMATVFTGIVGLDGNVKSPEPGSIALLVNFIIMIVLLIASLIIAKQWADRAGHGVPGLTKWAMGAAGGATLGMAGRFGRGTVGRVGAAIGDSEGLKERAAKGGVGGMAARLALATGRKTGGASFDVRGTPLGGPLEAGKAQKGGFAEFKKQQAKREADFAASLAPSAKAEAKSKAEYDEALQIYGQETIRWGRDSEQAKVAKQRMEETKQRKDRLSGNKAQIEKGVENLEKEKNRAVDEIRSSEELKSAEIREKSAYDTVSKLEVEAKTAEDNLREVKIKELEAAKIKLEGIKTEASEARKKIREQTERMTENYDARKKALEATEKKPVSEIRKREFADAVEKSYWAKARGYNYDAAAQIRKGKSTKDKAADILKDLQKEGVISEEEKPETPPPTPPTPPTP